MAGLAALAMAPALWAEGRIHHIAVHVNQNDPQVMTMALNNVQNLATHHRGQGDKVVIEVVACGPGLDMLIPDKSPVADRDSAMALERGGGLTLTACGKTHRKMSAEAGHEIALVDEARIVPSGVVRLVELQETGFSYVRP